MTDERGPGAYIGHEPESEEESIPGGVKSGDERVAAYGSRPGVDGEQASDVDTGPDPDMRDVVEGPVGDASLRVPATKPDMGADLALPGVERDPED
jgi:hypothetical protein